MSPVSWMSDSVLAWMVSTKSRCSAVSEVPSRRLVKPTMPLSGVRISWLIVARNWPLARSPACARSRASRSSVSLLVLATEHQQPREREAEQDEGDIAAHEGGAPQLAAPSFGGKLEAEDFLLRGSTRGRRRPGDKGVGRHPRAVPVVGRRVGGGQV